MTLPLVSAAAGKRGRRCLAGAVICVLLVAGWVAAARAQNADPYSATVKVDATAANVVKAREQARLDGERRALTEVVDGLAGGPDKVKMPTLDDNAITDMVVSFEVADERMSTVRYMADYTFHFRPADVQRVLRTAGVAAPAAGGAATAAGAPALVLPVYQVGTQVVLWEDPNPWRDAWTQVEAEPAANPGTAAGVAPAALTVPLADMGDVATIDGDKARAGDGDALAAIGRKYGTSNVLVAVAAARGPAQMPEGLDISVKRYRGGQFVTVHTTSLVANPGESAGALFRRAVQTVTAAIGNNWQGMPSVSEQQATLTATVPITSLDDWVRLRNQIAGLSPVRQITLRALSRQLATVEIGYVGDIDQLKTSLAGLGINLVQSDSGWTLAPSAAAAGPQ